MEIKRRPRVIGIFPNRASLMRMVGTLLQEEDVVGLRNLSDHPIRNRGQSCGRERVAPRKSQLTVSRRRVPARTPAAQRD